jgi:hypothetical protein
MALSVSLCNLRDDEGAVELADPNGVVPQLCTSLEKLDGEFPLLRSFGQDETILNWLQVRPLRAEVLNAAEQLGLTEEARPVLATLGEWSLTAIEMIWFVRVTAD